MLRPYSTSFRRGRHLPIRYPRIYRHPVHLPRLPSIVRERLLEPIGVRRNVGEHIADENSAPAEVLLIEKLPAPVPELADRGHAQRSGGTVGKVQAPLMGLRIVEPQGEAFDAARGPIDDELHQIGLAVPHLSDDGCPVVRDPRRIPAQRMTEASQLRSPGADLEVEIVTAVPVPRGLARKQHGAQQRVHPCVHRSSCCREMLKPMSSRGADSGESRGRLVNSMEYRIVAGRVNFTRPCRSPGPPPTAISPAADCAVLPRHTVTAILRRCTAGPSKTSTASGAPSTGT